MFLKAFVLLGTKQQREFRLFTQQAVLEDHLKLMDFNYQFSNNGLYLSQSHLLCEFLAPDPQKGVGLQSLDAILSIITPDDVLLTMPTSKDQFKTLNGQFGGHTEYFRHYYNNAEIVMTFKAPDAYMALISDHVALKDLPHYITQRMVNERVQSALNGHKKYFGPIDEVILSGINPHAGEGGLLGKEEALITRAILDLRKNNPTILFKGPIPGDSLHMSETKSKSQMLVYMFHDQGLARFKAQHRTIGINISFGLPFLRMSVDHGTAFDLYGKNQADYNGCYYMLTEACRAHQRMNPSVSI